MPLGAVHPITEAAIDFSPLFRSSMGIDRILRNLDPSNKISIANNWPPYDIVKTGEDNYRIDMAIAGFAENDLMITQEHNILVVRGQKISVQQGSAEYPHRGIAGREFEHCFDLVEHMKVVEARFENGLLSIIIKRELPEAMKPRRIAITSSIERADRALPRLEAPKEAV
ncbi:MULTISPECIES: Hsp20 family protein [Acetobacter]|nr:MULTISPECIES: Hsp20 family protein [Acetobacter]KAA8383799.1 Hsp20 family protein [Acetobacter sp. DmW_136]